MSPLPADGSKIVFTWLKSTDWSILLINDKGVGKKSLLLNIIILSFQYVILGGWLFSIVGSLTALLY